MPRTEELTGSWTRSLMAWPDGRRDTTTVVNWLQGLACYADLRQPPGHAARLARVRCLNDLTVGDCQKLAAQQAFAGMFVALGGDVFEWRRVVDYQPPRPDRDVGRMYWQADVLVEEGLHNEYIEHWHRDPALPSAPCAALTLRGAVDGRYGLLLRVANMFMYVRDRATPISGATLAALVNAAPSVEAARAMVDFEISFGDVSARDWRITRSTLPFRQAVAFDFNSVGDAGLRTAGLAPDGANIMLAWEIVGAEGDTSIFLDRKHEIFP